MTTITVEALASFGSDPISDEVARTNLFLLCGSPSPGSLERCCFEFIDGQELRPGARGAVRMTFAAERLPPLSGPLAVWAGRIIGHIWGLHTVYRSQLEAPRIWPRPDSATGTRGCATSAAVTDLVQTPSVLRSVSQPAM